MIKIKGLTIDEAMFDSGFSELRFKIADYFKQRYTVTNVTKVMGGNEDVFTAISLDDPSICFRFISTGTGVKCPGFFNNAALSCAFDKILAIMS